jgi:hypothetical protein
LGYVFIKEKMMKKENVKTENVESKKTLVILGNGSKAGCFNFDFDNNCEIWATAVSLFNTEVERIDKVFEIHRKDEYLHDTYEKIYQTNLPVYMQKLDDKVKNCFLFPYDEILEKYGEYQCSSFSLMLCFAVEQGYTDIVLYGIDYDFTGSDREVAIERPNLEYWIGYFRSKGININVKYTPLCRSVYRYGVDDIIRPLFFFDEIEERLRIAGEKYRYRKDKKETYQEFDRLLTYIKKLRSYF